MAESSESIIRQLRASVEAAERKRDEFASSATLAADRANRNRAEVDRLASIIEDAVRVLRDRDTSATPDEYRQRAAGDAGLSERYEKVTLLHEVLVERADRWRRLADLQELKALVKVPGEAIDWSHRLCSIECSERWARVASEDADEDGRDDVAAKLRGCESGLAHGGDAIRELIATRAKLAAVERQRDELQARLEQLTAPVESFDLAWLRRDGDPCCHCGTPLSQHGREDHDFVESLPVEEILAREVVRLRAAVEVPRG